MTNANTGSLGQAVASEPPEPPPRRVQLPTTKKLSAAAYLDDRFRNESLRHVIYQRQRLPAPSYYFDLAFVTQYCRRAHRLALTRDLVLVAVSAVALYLSGPGWAVVVIILTLAYCVFVALPSVLKALSIYSGRWLVRIAKRTPAALSAKRAFAWTVLALVVLVLPAIVPGLPTARWSARWFWALVVVAAVVVVVSAVWRWAEMRSIAENSPRSKPQADPEVSGLTPPEVQPWSDLHRALTVRYSQDIYGQLRPLQGSGVPLAADPLTVVLRPDEDQDQDVRLPSVDKIFDRLRDELRNLDDRTTSAAGHGSRLLISEQVVLSGRYVNVETGTAHRVRLINTADSMAQHFLVCQLASAAPEIAGEVVVTVFVHLNLRTDALVLSQTPCILLPTDGKYELIHDPRKTARLALVPTVVMALLCLPRDLLMGPPRTASSLLTTGQGVLNAIASIGGPGRFTDVGAIASIRELGLGRITPERFHFNIAQEYLSLLTKRIPSALSTTLAGFGLDVSDLNRAITRTQNISMTVGGDINVAGSLNVGGHQYNAPGGDQKTDSDDL
jgi:hypothetical protein